MFLVFLVFGFFGFFPIFFGYFFVLILDVSEAGLLFVTLPELWQKSLLFFISFFILSPNPNSTFFT